MSEVRECLEAIGLVQYADAFEANDIDIDLLGQVDDQMLKDIGVSSAGHRLRIRNAIAKLSPARPLAKNENTTSAATEPKIQDTAERRQVTVMFSDLVGSTALSARMDPEDLREVMSAYQKCVAVTVQRFGGFVAKYMGDGVLVYFGYPRAHEDDAERAARAGLELIQAVGGLKSGAPLQTRVGIATGLVVVGDLIGTGSAQEQPVVGETPNLAARLQALAEPNTVVIGESTRQLTRGLFEYRDLGTVSLKGFSESVPAWELIGTSEAESRFEALRVATTPLVGRDEEMALLARRWDQAKAGDGQIVLICGEPGIGKSRIAQTVVERVSVEPHTRLRYFCSPHHQDSALYPSIAQLERAAGFRREDTHEQRLDKLEAVLAQGTNDLSEIVPLLADLLSIPTGDRYPPLNLTPHKRKEETLHAQLAQVAGLAARHPVLMVFEDVHWSDPTTRESLDLVIDRVPRLRVLVIITFRPEFTPLWVGRPQVTMLTLNRLAPRQRAEMIVHVTGGKALPREIAEQIVDRTDGVPLFIEELTKTVVESGIVAEEGDHYALKGPVAPLAIPTTLHASLLARLDRLAPTREVAQIGAALGRSFSHELISAVAQIPQQKIDETLAQLVAAELIFRRGTPPDAEYTFKHALVQDAAYSTLLRSRRQQIHGRIATTLESQFPETMTAQPELLAHHCGEAGLTEKAVGYWLKAGQQAVARSAMTEAVAQLRRGLALLASMPDGADHEQRELELQAALVPAVMAAKGYTAPEVGETIARARSLAEKLDRTDYLIGLNYGEMVYRLVRGELKLTLSLAKSVEQIGVARKDRAAQLMGRHWLQGVTHYFLGDFVTARALLEDCEGLQDSAHRAVFATMAANDPYASTLAYLGMTLTVLGYIDQGRRRANAAVSEARLLRSQHSLAEVLTFAGWTERHCGSSRTVQQHAEEVVALSSEHGLPFWLELGTVLLGWSSAALGDARHGLDLIKKGMSLFAATDGAKLPYASALTNLSECDGALGHAADGLSCLDEAAQIIDTMGHRVWEVDMFRVRGDLLNAAGDRAAAEESYRRALAVARSQTAKTLELRAATSLARLWRDQGKRAEARDALAPVYGWFTEGFNTPVLLDAKALLDELAS